ncbi:MAG: TonB-dependent receptor [Bacteroidota bacterium]
MKNILTIFFSFFSVVIFSQNATLKGKVVDASTSETLIGVNIITQNGTGVVTDLDGNYQLSLEPGNYSITFRYVGYVSKTEKITLTAGQVKVLDVSLSEANTELETVVVSAGRYEQKIEDITVTIAVLKPALIENKNTLNCETILEQVPGVSIQDGQVSIRGGSGFAYGAGSRVLMMVDELPLLSADAGDVKWNTLPVENIEQIEVIKGASSVLFGSSALNGIINIRTGYAKDKPITKVSLTHGVYDNPKRDSIIWWDQNPFYTGVNFFHAQKFGQFDMVVGGAGFSDVGYRLGEDEHRARFNFNTRYRSKKTEGLSFGLNGNFQASRGGVFLIWQDANNVYRPYGGDTSQAGSSLSYNFGRRVNIDPYLTYFTKKGDRHSLRTRVYWVRNENNTNQSSNAILYYGEYQFQKTFKNELNLSTGIAGYYSGIVSQLYGGYKDKNLPLIKEGDSTYGVHYGKNLAVFAQADKKFGRLNLSLGLRCEYFKVDTAESVSTLRIIRGEDTTTLPFQPVFRTGMSYRLADETYLRASFGQGYRFPSVAEKFVSTTVGGLTIYPNPDLGPERGWSAEIGLKQGIKIKKWMGYADVAFFWTEYKNMMEFAFGSYVPDSIPIEPFNPFAPGYPSKWMGFRAQNAESARINGVDFSIIGKGKIGKKIDMSVFAGYTYMNPITLNKDSAYLASFSDSSTNILKYRYKHLVKADIQFDYKKITTGISARYTSKMPNIDRTFEHMLIPYGLTYIDLGDALILPGLTQYRKEHNKGYIIFDYRFGVNLNENARVALIVNNVFNVEYMGRPGDVQPPRTWAMQVVLNF